MINISSYLLNKIIELKKRKNALILAHYYQIPDIQDVADFVGDSLGLSQNAYQTEADIIVFAGVHFMAETAKILNPDKKVLIPDIKAGCSLAESCKPKDFKNFIHNNPGHIVISYINCSAEIKALSDVICTSSNAIKVVESFPKDQKIIFAPDKNLGSYVNHITGRKMLLWNGTCEIHDLLKTEEVVELKKNNPDAQVIAHPECKNVILEMADYVGSTTSLLNFTVISSAKKFIVATETGILHQMKKLNPGKEFLIVPANKTCSCNDCPYMKMNTIEKLYRCLKHEKPEIRIPFAILEKARKPILKMLDISA